MAAQEFAETLALKVLGHILSQDDLRMQFLSATGADARSLRDGAGDPVFLAAVMDFVLSEDRLVVSCAESLGLAPQALAAARAALPGGDLPDWT